MDRTKIREITDAAYRDGYKGRKYSQADRTDEEENAYYEAYDAGECDRPSLDEAMGVDYQKEMSDPLGW